MKCVMCDKRAEYILDGFSFCDLHFKEHAEKLNNEIEELKKMRRDYRKSRREI
jgi:hypothetical protein